MRLCVGHKSDLLGLSTRRWCSHFNYWVSRPGGSRSVGSLNRLLEQVQTLLTLNESWRSSKELIELKLEQLVYREMQEVRFLLANATEWRPSGDFTHFVHHSQSSNFKQTAFQESWFKNIFAKHFWKTGETELRTKSHQSRTDLLETIINNAV